ncbi:MAG TPA: DNA ligase D [Kofleriaceae bacterium]|nr:DNA ligase D [Kofleriaceae bacterium]
MPANSRSGGGLGRYRAKRSAGATPEPFGSETRTPVAAGAGRFVVQKHAARRLHYDFRLELGGVLLSWAVPRGPSLDPGEKRMAVMVENHPLEYADFEGVIPEGNYGAGPVIVWDRGAWLPVEDPQRGLEDGKLLFDLFGHKLRGRWQLVRTKRSGAARDAGERPADGAGAGEWLLIKKPDAFADAAGERVPPETSVLSGLDVEEVRAGRRGEEVAAALAAAGAKKKRVDPFSLRLMLCETREKPSRDPAWVYELKVDGFRLVAGLQGGRPFLRYRGGTDATDLYPEIALALRAMPYDDLVLDGEVVVLDASGRPDFGRLQARAMLGRARDVARAALSSPAHFMVFDLLSLGGLDTRDLPLTTRKAELRRVVPDVGVLRYVDHVVERGDELYAQVEHLGLEGIVAKRADAPYRAGRSPHWLKVRSMLSDDFAVVGWTPPKGETRTGFSGLHLAARDGGGWIYAGKVGGGFADSELAAIRRTLDESPPARYGFAAEGITRASRWVEPRLVAHVRYKEWAAGRLLRQPTFLRMRDDKRPDECVVPHRTDAVRTAPAAEPVAEAPRTVQLTNLDKIFWPADQITKGDLLAYYRAMAPWLLPYLADRPLVLTRYPDGIDGKSFYQKDAPEWAPEWVRTTSIWSEDTQREIHYFVCDDIDTLTYVVQSGTIPLHVWSSCVSDLARPDWCILDLDPKGAPFSDVVELALAIRRLCDELELATAVKTSGSTGLHVLVPLARQMTYDQSRSLAGLLVKAIETERPDISTTARVIDARGGKVYLDWLQNRHGQLLVAPYSARPLPGAPVSMPLRWSEVGKKLDHTRFTVKTAQRRMERLGEDPVRMVLSHRPDLLGALARLDARMKRKVR